MQGLILNILIFFFFPPSSMQIETPKKGEMPEIKKNQRKKATKVSWSLGSQRRCPLSQAFISCYLRTRAIWPPQNHRRVKWGELKKYLLYYMWEETTEGWVLLFFLCKFALITSISSSSNGNQTLMDANYLNNFTLILSELHLLRHL